MLLASVQTKHTEAVGWLSSINLLYHPKVRMTLKIVTRERIHEKDQNGATEKEYQLKCCGLYHSEGVKSRDSQTIQN